MKANVKNKLIICMLIFVAIIPLLCNLVYALPEGMSETWYDEDWTNTKNATQKTITLSKYKGTLDTYKVPARAAINGEEYTVILGGSNSYPFYGTAIKNLSVEEGVKINYPAYLFYQAKNLESADLTGADTTSATSVKGMFYQATNLKKVNMSGLDLSKVTNVQYMFYQAANIEEIDFSNLNMSKVTTFAYSNATNNFSASPLYGMYNLKKVNFNNFNTESLKTAQRMFTMDANNSGNKNSLEEIDVTNWKTPNVTSFNEAFKHCGENNECTIKGLETLNTSNVTDFGGMFQSCYKIKDLTGVENWDTSKAQKFHSMFSECKAITKLDLSKWNTSNVTDIGSMFLACEALTDLNVSTWNTSKVSQMDEVFKGCASLQVLNLKNWTSESIQNKAGSHMNEMLGIGNSRNARDYELTPLKEITLNDNFIFSTFASPGLRSGYWHLKEGTTEETSVRFTPARLYTAYNTGITPPDGYSHDHTYVLTELDPATAEYYGHGWGDNNVWEVHYLDDKFKGYCINLHRGSPNGYYNRTKVSNNSILNEGFLDSDNYGWEPLGSNMEEALITLIYYGYGNDADGIQEKYGLTDGEFLLITQQAIWDFTDRYNNISERDRSTKYGQAHYELVSKRFSDIPNGENLKLYLYESIDGKQNLLSISGLSNVAHAGVRVLKLADNGEALEPLIGAEFTIRDSDNNVVATIVSDENGYATKYNTDSIYGLPEGIYTIQETKAPREYKKGTSATKYTFIVRPEDDNEIITVGKLNGSGEDTPMIFENTEDTSVTGGGVKIQKLSDTGEKLIGAKFEIYDEAGNKVSELISGKDGIALTGNKDLELNKKYTIKEIEAPNGYTKSSEEKTFTLTKNKEYYDETIKIVNEAKKGKVVIEATKILKNGTLEEGQFEFELIDNNGNVVATAKNDKEGKIKFEIEYNGSQIGYMVYKLREVKGNSTNIDYDKHEEEIIVYISDDGEDELKCMVEYDDDGAVFENVYQSNGQENEDDNKNDEENKDNGSKVAKTGVDENTAYLSLLMVIAVAALVVFLTTKDIKRAKRYKGKRTDN